jgi:chromosome segregation ATPase
VSAISYRTFSYFGEVYRALLCQFAEVNGHTKAEYDAQFEGLRGAIDKVATKQFYEREKVLGLQEAMREVRHQINQINEVVERRIEPLEQTAFGLAETKDRTSRVESDVTGLRVAMGDRGTKVEEVRREVAGLKAQLSAWSKVKKEMRNLQQEFAKLKEEMRTAGPKAEPPAADRAVPV